MNATDKGIVDGIEFVQKNPIVAFGPWALLGAWAVWTNNPSMVFVCLVFGTLAYVGVKNAKPMLGMLAAQKRINA